MLNYQIVHNLHSGVGHLGIWIIAIICIKSNENISSVRLANSLFAISNNSFTVDKMIPPNRDNDINNIVISIVYLSLKFYNSKTSN